MSFLSSGKPTISPRCADHSMYVETKIRVLSVPVWYWAAIEKQYILVNQNSP